jgi:dihydropteroate synthase
MTPQDFEIWLKNPAREPLVMGVLNVTPDSFSDGGRFADPTVAVAHARQMVEDGASLIDVGGESTRPGAPRVPTDEQIRRIVPIIQAMREAPALLSVDTTSAGVAAAALDAGCHLVNDISGGIDDGEMLPLVARREVPVVLMHMRGQPANMQSFADYGDVVSDVTLALAARRDAAVAAGVAPHRVILDPGIGFAKKMEHNLTLLRRLGELQSLGRPLLLGTSRKSFIGRITGEDDPSNRLFGTAASVAWCLSQGAAIVRVHDVGPMAKVTRMIRAIQRGP